MNNQTKLDKQIQKAITDAPRSRGVGRKALSFFLCLVLLASVCIPVVVSITESTAARANTESGHAHVGSCFKEEFILTCGVYEGYGAVTEYIEGYAHRDGCHEKCEDTEEMILICTSAVRESQTVILSRGHLHGDDCFEFIQTLVCSLPETNHPVAESATPPLEGNGGDLRDVEAYAS